MNGAATSRGVASVALQEALPGIGMAAAPLFAALLALVTEPLADRLGVAGLRSGILFGLISLVALGMAGAHGLGGGSGPEADVWATVASGIVCLSALLCVSLSLENLGGLKRQSGEYYALGLLSVSGLVLALHARDLLVLVLSIELAGLPLHALAALDRSRSRSQEAGIKLHAMGGLASAFLLYGVALVYGATGALDFAGVQAGAAARPTLLLLGLGCMLVGLLGKLGLAPFHQWLPDLFEGAGMPVSLLAGIIARIGAFLILARIVTLAGPSPDAQPVGLFAALAVLSMAWGALQAAVQSNLKRLLGHAAVAQAGLLAITFASTTELGRTALVVGLIADLLAHAGALSMLVTLSAHDRGARGDRGRDIVQVSDLAGLATQRPGSAWLLAICLLSLAAAPGTVGFIARLGVLESAVEAGRIDLLIVAALTSAALLYAYLQPIVQMFIAEPTERGFARASSGELSAISVSVAGILYFGIAPAFQGWLPATTLYELARMAVAGL